MIKKEEEIEQKEEESVMI